MSNRMSMTVSFPSCLTLHPVQTGGRVANNSSSDQNCNQPVVSSANQLRQSNVKKTPPPFTHQSRNTPSLGYWKAMEVATLQYLGALVAKKCPVKTGVAQKLVATHQALTDDLRPWLPNLLADELRDLLNDRLVYLKEMVTALRLGSRQELTYAEMGLWCYSDRLASALASINPKWLSLRQTQEGLRFYHDLLRDWVKAQLARDERLVRRINQQLTQQVTKLAGQVRVASVQVNSDQNYGAGIDRTLGADAVFPPGMF